MFICASLFDCMFSYPSFVYGTCDLNAAAADKQITQTFKILSLTVDHPHNAIFPCLFHQNVMAHFLPSSFNYLSKSVFPELVGRIPPGELEVEHSPPKGSSPASIAVTVLQRCQHCHCQGGVFTYGGGGNAGLQEAYTHIL